MQDQPTEQRSATVVALEMCEIMGAEQPGLDKANRILDLLFEVNQLQTEWIGDASGIAIAIKAATTGLARDFFQGGDMQDENCREYYAELICAITALADKLADIIDRNTAFASLHEAVTTPTSAALH